MGSRGRRLVSSSLGSVGEVTVMVHGVAEYVFSFEAQLHNLSELINTNDWYGYGELNSFWIQQDDNFFMIEKLFW